MTYSFQRSPNASIKIDQWRHTDGSTLTLQGVNGTLSSADSIVAGVSQLLSVVSLESAFDPSNMSRVVTEYVVGD